ncbi:MAG: putative sulfate/molybdate transporter [Candidatus Omnitrophota bacterium]|nr:putative sulfate/molybdate transporter [Candidatus Omnitrophota bacterium]MDZ4242890.1 putative sulfate/molybdate transporter [Candidatus Omnitrophota bacterium]
MLKFFSDRVRFNRNEFSGSFGDIGTDFPLITGMILACGLDVTSTFVMFGAMQVLTGVVYGIPMAVQPLKIMAVIMITQKLSGNILYGGGLAIGVLMLALSLSGLLGWVARVIPKSVIRGVQFGLGLQLAMLSLKDYIPSEGAGGYALAGIGFLMIVFLLGNKKCPPAPFVILLGIIYALVYKADFSALPGTFGVTWPQPRVPALSDILTGLVMLTLPQVPLSICNSIFATRQTVEDFFPEKPVTVRRIGLTYSLMNLLNPFFGGIPTCHGSGGMAGHHAFGARTGGSVVIYGIFYLVLGLFFSKGFGEVIHFFPKPVLGTILVFEGLALMRLMRDLRESRGEFALALLVGVMAAGLPYGYLVAMILGTCLKRCVDKQWIRWMD